MCGVCGAHHLSGQKRNGETKRIENVLYATDRGDKCFELKQIIVTYHKEGERRISEREEDR